MGLHILRQPDGTSARSLVAHNLARLLFFRISLYKRGLPPAMRGKLAWIDALLEAWVYDPCVALIACGMRRKTSFAMKDPVFHEVPL